MTSEMQRLLSRFLELYERDPIALDIALGDTGSFAALIEQDAEYVDLPEQVKILTSSVARARKEIYKKTLISTSIARRQAMPSWLQPDDSIDDLMTNSQKIRQTEAEQRSQKLEIAEVLGLPPDWTMRDLMTKAAEMQGMTFEEHQAEQSRQRIVSTLKATKLESELLRFFADRLPDIADTIERFDSTDFSRLVPDCLIVPFRDCHVNFVLGNYGTTAVLCGAILERAFQDLLNTPGAFFELLEDAEREELLLGPNVQHAKKIYRLRNHAMHGKKNFEAVSPLEASEAIDMTRRLVTELYRDRLSSG